MKKLVLILIVSLLTVPVAAAEPEIVRFTPECEFTVTFPGKISTRIQRSNSQPGREWMHVRDIEYLGKHYEITAICKPTDSRNREFELLMLHKNMEKEARRVQIEKPHTAFRQDKKHGIVLGEWKGFTHDKDQKAVSVEGRYILGRQSKLLMLVATPGSHPKPATRIADFFNSVRRK